MSSVYSFPAVTTKASSMVRKLSDDENKQREAQRVARKKAVDALITSLFPDQRTLTSSNEWVDSLPTVHFDSGNGWSLPKIEIKWVQRSGYYRDSDATHLQFTYIWAYGAHCKRMRRLKLTRNGEVDEIDKAKADAMAAEFLALHQQHVQRDAECKVAQDKLTATKAAAFAPLRKALKAQGVFFYAVGTTGGTILLTDRVDDPRLQIEGGDVQLAMGPTYSPQTYPVKLELVPDFLALFKRNS